MKYEIDPNAPDFDVDGALQKASTTEELGIMGHVQDIAMGVPRGMESAVRSTYNLVDDVGEWAGEKVTGEETDFLPDYNSNFLGESKTTAGGIIEGITEFATIFIPGQSVAKAAAAGRGIARAASLIGAGKAAKVAGKAMSTLGIGTGMAADAIITDEETELLSTMAKNAGFESALTDYLSGDEDDSIMEKKMKGAIEGAFVGLGMEGVMKAASPLLKRFKAKRLKNKAATEKFTPEELDAAIKEVSLGESDIKVLKEMQEGIVKHEENITSVLKETEGLQDSMDLMGDMGSTVERNDALAVGKQNFRNVIEVNKKLEDTFLAIQTKGDMNREELNTLLDSALKLKEVTSLQGKSLAALKGQAKARDAVKASESLLAFRESIDKYKGMSDAEIGPLMDNLSSLSSPKEVRMVLNDQLSKIQPGVATKMAAMGQEMWKSMLLSNPGTMALNFAGNTFTLLHQPFSRAMSGVFKGDKVAIGSAFQEFKGLFLHAQESTGFAYKAFKRNIKTGHPAGILDSKSSALVDSTNSSQMTRKWSKAYVGDNAAGMAAEYMGVATNMPYTMLTGMDEGFKQLAARSKFRGTLFSKGTEKGLKGDALNAYMKTNSDEAFRESGEFMSREGLYAEGLQKGKAEGITAAKDLQDYAHNYEQNSFVSEIGDQKDNVIDYARHVTFQDELTGVSKAVADFAGAHPMTAGFVLPFVKTPMNVLKYSFEEFVNVADVARIFKSEFTSADIKIKGEAQARFATATTMAGTALAVANMGVITGSGPQDRNRNAALRATGWQPYSLKIGDKFYSYRRADPIATPIGMIADMVDRYRDGSLKDEDSSKLLNAVVLSMTESIKSKSYLQGIVEVVTMANDLSKGQGSTTYFASKLISSVIPSIVGSSIRVANKGNDGMVQTRSMFDGIMAKSGFDSTLEIKRNMMGEELKYSDTTNALTSMLTPTTVSKKRKDAVLQGIADTGLDMGQPSKKVDGVDLTEIKMEDGRSAYSHYMDLIRDTKIGGRTLREGLQRTMNTKRYKRAPEDPGSVDEDSLRAVMLKSTISKYRKAAKKKLYKKSDEFSSLSTERRNTRHTIRSGQSTVEAALKRLMEDV